MRASPNERKEILKTIPDISTVTWEHFNFQAAVAAGEFDFDETQHRDELEQDLQAMFDFQIDEDDLI